MHVFILFLFAPSFIKSWIHTASADGRGLHACFFSQLTVQNWSKRRIFWMGDWEVCSLEGIRKGGPASPVHQCLTIGSWEFPKLAFRGWIRTYVSQVFPFFWPFKPVCNWEWDISHVNVLKSVPCKASIMEKCGKEEPSPAVEAEICTTKTHWNGETKTDVKHGETDVKQKVKVKHGENTINPQTFGQNTFRFLRFQR